MTTTDLVNAAAKAGKLAELEQAMDFRDACRLAMDVLEEADAERLRVADEEAGKGVQYEP